jgi:gluconolactonase
VSFPGVPNPLEGSVDAIATGYTWTEGPVWVGGEAGHLLFSDVPGNAIHSWDGKRTTVFLAPSGLPTFPIPDTIREAGSNGLALGRGGLLIADSGTRALARVDLATRQKAVFAESYQGKRFNSPNDLVYKSDGSLYFTDPSFGLPRFSEDPRKELTFNGVFRLANGRLQLLSTDLAGPNGLAFSPDEKHLYVGNWDEKKKVVMRYDVAADGSLTNGRVFFDMTGAPGDDAIDGVKVDRVGNLYVSGPGGLWILSPAGTHLGTIVTPEHPHNFAWGDDGRSLYLTARSTLYRIRLQVSGAGVALPATN